MPRKGNVPKREVLPDPVYGSVVVAKLINSIMLDGKKGTAQAIVYDAFEQINKETGEDALEVFNKAMENIMPSVEVKARRVGGANYQVPMEVRPERRQTLALRWLTMFTRARGEKKMSESWLKSLSTLQTEQAHQLREKKIHTEWQKPIKHLLTSDGKQRGTCRKEVKRCLENSLWKEPGISVSWRTSMPVRRLLLKESSSTRAEPTKSAKRTKGPLQWTGWSRNRNVVSL